MNGIKLLSISLGLSLLLLFLPVSALGEAPPDPATEGNSVAQDIQSSWCSNTDDFTSKLTQPLMSPTSLSTLDGSKQGSAQIVCPGSEAIFTALIQPGATNDLSYLLVTYDNDLDGNFDGSYSTTSPISGMCADGVVTCNPGTWIGCRYYQWKYENSALFLEEVISRELSGCFCFNSGCTGAPFFAMQEQILNTLGSGIAGAMATTNPKMAVSKAQIDGMSISYFGQNVGDCTVDSGTLADLGLSNAENIYANAASLTTLSSAELAAQEGDPNSFYSLITNSTAFKNVTRDNCDMERDAYLESWCSGVPTAGASQASGACGAPGAQYPTVQFDWQVTYRLPDNTVTTLTGTQTRSLCTDHLMFTRTRMSPDGSTVYFEWAGTDPSGGVIGWNCYETTMRCIYSGDVYPSDSDWASVCYSECRIDCIGQCTQQCVIGCPPGDEGCAEDCQTDCTVTCGDGSEGCVTESNGYNDWMVIDQTTLPEGVVEWDARINITYSGGGCNTGTAISTAYWCTQEEKIVDVLVDHCQVLASDPKCRLEKETTFDANDSGVYTVFDFTPTGVIPLNTCRDYVGAFSTQTVCHDWWKIDRTYVCDAEPVTIDTSRQDTIDSTLTQSGSDFTYTDIRTDEFGASVTDTGSVTVDLASITEDCVKVCKLRMVDDTALSSGPATTADYQLNPAGSVDIYRTCVDDVCEIRPGEMMVTDCGCINEFNVAFGVMETARQGAVDMICSDGAPKASAF